MRATTSYLIRFVALLLIPCLVIDSMLAMDFSKSPLSAERRSFVFTTQAVPPAILSCAPKARGLFIKTRASFGSLLVHHRRKSEPDTQGISKSTISNDERMRLVNALNRIKLPPPILSRALRAVENGAFTAPSDLEAILKEFRWSGDLMSQIIDKLGMMIHETPEPRRDFSGETSVPLDPKIVEEATQKLSMTPAVSAQAPFKINRDPMRQQAAQKDVFVQPVVSEPAAPAQLLTPADPRYQEVLAAWRALLAAFSKTPGIGGTFALQKGEPLSESALAIVEKYIAQKLKSGTDAANRSGRNPDKTLSSAQKWRETVKQRNGKKTAEQTQFDALLENGFEIPAEILNDLAPGDLPSFPASELPRRLFAFMSELAIRARDPQWRWAYSALFDKEGNFRSDRYGFHLNDILLSPGDKPDRRIFPGKDRLKIILLANSTGVIAHWDFEESVRKRMSFRRESQFSERYQARLDEADAFNRLTGRQPQGAIAHINPDETSSDDGAPVWRDAIDWLMHAPEPEVRELLGDHKHLMEDVMFVRAAGGASSIVDFERILFSRAPDEYGISTRAHDLALLLKTSFRYQLTSREHLWVELLKRLRDSQITERGRGISIRKLLKVDPRLTEQSLADPLHELETHGYIRSTTSSGEIVWWISRKGEWLLHMAAMAGVTHLQAAESAAWAPPSRRPAVETLPALPTASFASEERLQEVRAAWAAFRVLFPGAVIIGPAQAIEQGIAISEKSLRLVERHMDRVRESDVAKKERAVFSGATTERLEEIRTAWRLFRRDFPQSSSSAAGQALEKRETITTAALDIVEKYMHQHRAAAAKKAAKRAARQKELKAEA